MGSAAPNPLVELRGKIGKLSIAKYGNKLIVRRLPERKRRPATVRQKPVRQKLVRATAYWKSLSAQPERKAAYVLAGRLSGRRAYDLAKADFLSPPAVTDIDLSGYIGQPTGEIRAQAEDDFEVISVRVRILELAGSVIEEGEAAKTCDSGRWAYATSMAVPAGQAVMIEATPADRPGNQAVKRFDHVCGFRK